MFWKKRRGIITITYEGIQNRCMEKICKAGFQIEYVVDYPELRLLQFTGTHRKIPKSKDTDFYRVFLRVYNYKNEYNYKAQVRFVESVNLVTEAEWAQSYSSVRAVHIVINEDLQQ